MSTANLVFINADGAMAVDDADVFINAVDGFPVSMVNSPFLPERCTAARRASSRSHLKNTHITATWFLSPLLETGKTLNIQGFAENQNRITPLQPISRMGHDLPPRTGYRI